MLLGERERFHVRLQLTSNCARPPSVVEMPSVLLTRKITCVGDYYGSGRGDDCSAGGDHSIYHPPPRLLVLAAYGFECQIDHLLTVVIRGTIFC